MEYRLLGGSGLKVPVLSFGTATFGGGNEFFRAWGGRDAVAADVRTSPGLRNPLSISANTTLPLGVPV